MIIKIFGIDVILAGTPKNFLTVKKKKLPNFGDCLIFDGLALPEEQ